MLDNVAIGTQDSLGHGRVIGDAACYNPQYAVGADTTDARIRSSGLAGVGRPTSPQADPSGHSPRHRRANRLVLQAAQASGAVALLEPPSGDASDALGVARDYF